MLKKSIILQNGCPRVTNFIIIGVERVFVMLCYLLLSCMNCFVFFYKIRVTTWELNISPVKSIIP